MPMSDFWGKKDDILLARALRLAIIQNVFDQGLITEEQARELLSRPLSPTGGAVYDDSDCLEIREYCSRS